MYMHGSVVKLGSPNLNLLIIAGASLLYLAMFFYSMSMHKLSQQLEETLLCNVSHVDCVQYCAFIRSHAPMYACSYK